MFLTSSSSLTEAREAMADAMPAFLAWTSACLMEKENYIRTYSKEERNKRKKENPKKKQEIPNASSQPNWCSMELWTERLTDQINGCAGKIKQGSKKSKKVAGLRWKEPDDG